MRLCAGLLMIVACTTAKKPTVDSSAVPTTGRPAGIRASARPRQHDPEMAATSDRTGIEPEVAVFGDAYCRAQGFDFAFDDEENGCGVGPGTACTDERMNYCSGATAFLCNYGKMGSINCREYCREAGDLNGTVYDSGRCTHEDRDTTCVCCDFREPGCERGPV